MAEARKRLLFVDDYEVLLNALKAALRSERARWEVDVAVGPEAALTLLGTHRYDVAVTDLEMPGMDGVSLLEVLKQKSPGTARVIMSGQLASPELVRAAPVMHRFMPKPVAMPDLKATLLQLLTLQELLGDHGLRDFVGGEGLPSSPTVYLELTQAASRADTGLKELALIIERDPAVSAKVLQLANSAWLRSASPALSVETALVRLGVELTRALALSAYVFSQVVADPSLPLGLQPAHLQERALLTARLSKHLCPEQAELAFLGGLLQPVGLLPLLRRHRDAVVQAFELAKAGQELRAAAERRLLGASAAQVGAYLLGLWGLPSALTELVLAQAEVPRAEAPLGVAGTVWLSAAVVDEHLGAAPPLGDAFGLAAERQRFKQALSNLL